jgi:hypothetical protein
MQGTTWGVALWLMAQVIVMPMMGGGLFSSAMGGASLPFAPEMVFPAVRYFTDQVKLPSRCAAAYLSSSLDRMSSRGLGSQREMSTRAQTNAARSCIISRGLPLRQIPWMTLRLPP